MSDQTPDPHDEPLRAALDAEADGVHAGPELLARIQSAAAGSSRRRVAPWLLAAAALLAIIGIATAVLWDDEQTVDVSNDPSSTTSPPTSTTDGSPPGDLYDALSGAFRCEVDGGSQTVFFLGADATPEQIAAVGTALDADTRVQGVRVVPQAEVAAALEAAAPGADWDAGSIPSGYVATFVTAEDDLAVRGVVSDLPGVEATSSTDCASSRPTHPEQPALVALVHEDGWLVTVDLPTGVERELYFGGDPNATTDGEEGGPRFVDGVELSPDGRTIFFSTCCEPASGSTYRISVDGGEPEYVAQGSAPRLSPDGRFLATGGGTVVFVTPTDSMPSGASSIEVACCTRSLAWSPDGTGLLIVTATGSPGEAPEVLQIGWDGSTLTPQDMGKPENPGSFVSWTPDGTPVISSGGPIDDERSLAQDASYRWLLWVDEEGVVREQAGHESSDRTPIPGLPEALSADW